jgi:hypothetical protein
MPLQAPNLDDRNFKTLVSEARSRIPRYLPEWTDWNDSDPGITLLQLHAWLTETILYRLNRLPDLNYVKFLQLLGVERRPARPAQANLTFLLKEKADRAEILIPMGTVVTVAARDLPQPLAFETDRTLVAISAQIKQLLTVGADAGPAVDVVLANLVSGQTFPPFGVRPQRGAALLLGFSSELPFSREEIGLQIDLAEAGQALVSRARVARCGSTAEDAETPRLTWQWWDGLQWAPLDITADETDCLTCSGHIYFKVPGQIPAVPLRSLADGPAGIPLKLNDVAGIGALQVQKLQDAGIKTVSDLAQLTPDKLAEILGDTIVTPQMRAEALRFIETQLKGAGFDAITDLAGLTERDKQQLNEYLDTHPEFTQPFADALKDTLNIVKTTDDHPENPGLTEGQIDQLIGTTLDQFKKLLASLLEGEGVVRTVNLDALKTQTLIARFTSARLTLSEREQARQIIADAGRLLQAEQFYWLRVGLESGTYASPPIIDQILTNTVQATAARTVLDEAVGAGTGRPNQQLRLRYAPVLAEPPLELEVDGETWTEVSDFYASRPSDNHYTLNRTSGAIAFGDGMRGRMPPAAGGASIVARQYRYGGGQIGNVGSGTITGLSSHITWVEQVTNYRAAVGGADEESLSDTLLRAPREFKARDRAVTLEDFEVLACATPGAQVARAAAYASGGQPGNTRLINIVIVPQSADARPLPSEATLRLVCRYLDERRLITTRVAVAGPAYHDIDVVLDVRAQPQADLKAVKNAIDARLQDYFHPLRGGPNGSGWPFGRDIYYSELLRELMEVDGVQRIESVTLRKFLLPQLIAGATAASTQPQETNSPQAIGPSAASAPRMRQGISPHIVAGGFTTERAALAQIEVLLQSESAAFAGRRPVAKVMPMVVMKPASRVLASQHFYVVAEYECADLPVAPGALVALHEASISVSYDRTRGSP